MRNIYDEELDILWKNYDDIIDKVGYYDMLNEDSESLKHSFTLLYKQIYYQVKEENSYKERGEMKYNLLKLRRIFAIWQLNNVVDIEGGIRYAEKDKYKQFPKYNMQNPLIVPTIKTINKLRMKALLNFADTQEMKDLRSLRGALKGIGLDNEKSNFLTDLYKKMQQRNEVNDFSQKLDEFDKMCWQS